MKLNSNFKTKIAKVRLFLLAGEKLTSLDAVDLIKTTRLAAIIHELRKEGLPIVTIMITRKDKHGKIIRYGKYYIPPLRLKEYQERHNCG
jgi:hypothetical protein